MLRRTGWSRFWPETGDYLGSDIPGDASKQRFPRFGEAAGSTATLRLTDDYVQTPSGTLDIELGGPERGEYDRLEVAGTATLGGTLRLSVVDGYRPGKGERFEILTAGSVVGTFERIEGPDGIWVALIYTETAVEVEILTGVAVEDDQGGEAELPEAFSLEQNYPNPFNPSTSIRYAVPTAGQVRLEVFDVMGRRIAVLVDRVHAAGWHEVAFGAEDLPSGVYLYTLDGPGTTQSRIMTLAK